MGLGHIILIIGLLFVLADYINYYFLTCICKKARSIKKPFKVKVVENFDGSLTYTCVKCKHILNPKNINIIKKL